MTDRRKEAIMDAIWQAVDEGTFEFGTNANQIVDEISTNIMSALEEINSLPISNKDS